ncbi:MAG: hypothetical protein MK538_07605 [Planctomycetes bacterium]|nr:hypothetical protein [Planctomycetota bacterium]
MVGIFARSITDDLTSLVKEIDKTVGKNKAKQMRSFLILLSKDVEADDAKLKKLAKAEKITNAALTVFDGVAGPPNCKVAKDAEVTVMMWVGRGRVVKSNHAFAKGELNKAAIEKVVKDTSKVLSAASLTK